jgi:hypothetical protein
MRLAKPVEGQELREGDESDETKPYPTPNPRQARNLRRLKQESEGKPEDKPKLHDAIHRAEEKNARKDQDGEQSGGQPALKRAALEATRGRGLSPTHGTFRAIPVTMA